MNSRLCLITSALMFGSLQNVCGQATSHLPEPVPVITVCEALNDLSRYNGKSVILVGRFASSEEGSWLSENCERTIVIAGHTWANIISTTYSRSEVSPPPELPKGFKWEERTLMMKLRQVQTTTTLRVLKQYNYSDKWMAMFGRFETRLPVQVVVGGDGKPRGYGFGHMNAALAQLIASDQAFKELTPR